MEPALLPVGFLQAAVELLQGQLRLRAQEEDLPVEMLQLNRKGHGHWGVAIKMGEPSEDLGGGGHLGWAVQYQEAQGDMKIGGRVPVRGRGG